jgi:hypothetical protein
MESLAACRETSLIDAREVLVAHRRRAGARADSAMSGAMTRSSSRKRRAPNRNMPEFQK